MIKAQKQHQAIVVNLILHAFRYDPQFLAYTQGSVIKTRWIARLAFETCLISDTIFLTDDLNAVALCKPSVGAHFNAKILLINLIFPFIFGIRPLLNLMNIEKILDKKRKKTKKWLIYLDASNETSRTWKRRG